MIASHGGQNLFGSRMQIGRGVASLLAAVHTSEVWDPGSKGRSLGTLQVEFDVRLKNEQRACSQHSGASMRLVVS